MGKSNQKTVIINKEACGKKDYYAMINLNALQNASSLLDGDAFKMWIYFSKNQNHWKFDLSSKHVEESFKLSKRRYDNAIKELIQFGFLVDINNNPKSTENLWAFYELPKEKSNQDELVDSDDKPLQQTDTSLIIKEDQPCSTVDTRKNTEKKTITKSKTYSKPYYLLSKEEQQELDKEFHEIYGF